MTSDKDKKPCKHRDTRCPGIEMGLSCDPPCNHYEPEEAEKPDRTTLLGIVYHKGVAYIPQDKKPDPTDAQLDEFTATEVMGWEYVPGKGTGFDPDDPDLVHLGVYKANDCIVQSFIGWNPSNRIAQAFEVLGKWIDGDRTNRDYRIEAARPYPGSLVRITDLLRGVTHEYITRDDTPARAICLALYRMKAATP